MVITGVGVISALGLNRQQFWSALTEGRSGIGNLQGHGLEALQHKTGAQLQGYDAAQHFPMRQLNQLDPFAQYFVIAGREALQQSQYPIQADSQVGIFSGSAGGGQFTLSEQYARLYLDQSRVHPFTVPKVMSNSGASFLSQELGVIGPVLSFSAACSSANHALGHAFWMVRNGQLDAALAGGSEAPFCLGYMRAWESMRVMDPERCRPFSKNRQGMTLGEGGAVLMLESLTSAQQRGAQIYAEMVGFGMSSDASSTTKPLVEGAAASMRSALRDAELEPSAIDHINAHGTGTPLNDVTETQAIHQVFGAHSNSILVSSTKSAHGHALGAAGALEAAACIFAIDQQIAPATLGFGEADPECDLDYLHDGPRPANLKIVLSNSFALGGLNSSLVFKRF